ncbi:hypothetical protein FIBSPDRAFT_963750 [Athelia psychrophila]|uniref:Uncharacterized protein n=1 Tax=Athelia psychrophila TaxID=1759441 RepID=A0A165YM86_9AGAM|nr:hypothetical protein FIBSPDRAFT_963750 [Fibularhizoctonia sp. CBS 109695]
MAHGLLYWTQKGASKGQPGHILLANILPQSSPRLAHGHPDPLHLPLPIDLPLTPRSKRFIGQTAAIRPWVTHSTAPTSPPPSNRIPMTPVMPKQRRARAGTLSWRASP